MGLRGVAVGALSPPGALDEIDSAAARALLPLRILVLVPLLQAAVVSDGRPGY